MRMFALVRRMGASGSCALGALLGYACEDERIGMRSSSRARCALDA
jgi:hypothetical protein